MPRDILILGCGYTGRRVAARLAAQGHRVVATARETEALRHVEGISAMGLDVRDPRSLRALAAVTPQGCAVLHSVPMLDGPADPTSALLEALGDKPVRVVYLSTTSVYGSQHEVDEQTEPAPESEAARLRVSAEQLVLGGPWSSMVLRPAAIYGPGRGAHISIPQGRFKLFGDGSNYVSRIHVDDLAALAGAALLSSVTGAWPAGDEEPARSSDVARFVCDLLDCAMPQAAARDELHETRRADRRVDGRAVCRVLDVRLRYPSYREGIRAALTGR